MEENYSEIKFDFKHPKLPSAIKASVGVNLFFKIVSKNGFRNQDGR